MTDIIHIDQFTTQAMLGITPWERQIRQTVSIDIDYPVDCKSTAMDDNLSTTCDYAALTESLSEYLATNRFGLLETLAEHLAKHLLSSFSLDWVKLTIRKMGVIHQANHVAISIHRAKNA